MKKLAALLCLATVAAGAFAQNLESDMINNKLESLKIKVSALSPTLKEAPYLSIYLSRTKKFDPSMFNYLIEHGADLNQIGDEDKAGPLYMAAKYSQMEALNRLLELKVDPNSRWPASASDIEGFEVTQERASFPTPGVTQAARWKAMEKDVAYRTPLWAAWSRGNLEAVEALLAAGANPLATVSTFYDPKASTAKKAVYATKTLIGLILDDLQGAERHESARFACSTAIWLKAAELPAKSRPVLGPEVIRNPYVAILTKDLAGFKKTLAESKVDVLSFLPYALLASNAEAVTLIYTLGEKTLEDPALEDREKLPRQGGTAMEWALVNRYAAVVAFLVQQGAKIPASITYVDDQYRLVRRSPVEWAAATGNLKMLDVLLANKADLNANAPLRYGDAATKDKLIQAGADVNATFRPEGGKVDLDSLFAAASEGKLELVTYLLAKGANPNRAPNASPLIAATVRHHPDVVMTLLAAGSDTKAKVVDSAVYGLRGADGATALDIARAFARDTTLADEKVDFSKCVEVLTSK